MLQTMGSWQSLLVVNNITFPVCQFNETKKVFLVLFARCGPMRCPLRQCACPPKSVLLMVALQCCHKGVWRVGKIWLTNPKKLKPLHMREKISMPPRVHNFFLPLLELIFYIYSNSIFITFIKNVCQ